MSVIDRLAETWIPVLWQASWQGAITVLVVIVMCWLLRVAKSPEWTQNWLWRLVCLKFLVGLIITAPIAIPLLSPVRAHPVSETARPLTDTPTKVARRTGPALTVDTVRERVREKSHTALQRGSTVPQVAAARLRANNLPQPSGSEVPSWKSFLLLAWFFGVLANLFIFAKQLWTSATLQCSEVDDPSVLASTNRLARRFGVRAPQVVASEQIACPALVGLITPRVVLPSDTIKQIDETQIESVLSHELAHHRRRDLWWNLLPAAVQSLFFFHPLVWYANRRLKLSGEMACDAMAVDRGRFTANQYAECLLRVAISGSQRVQTQRLLGCVSVVGSAQSLKQRVHAMNNYQLITKRRALLYAFMIGCVGIAGVAPWRLVHRSMAAEPSESIGKNMSFESKGEGGHASDWGGGGKGYKLKTDKKAHSGKRCALIKGESKDGFGTYTQCLDATSLRGKRVAYSGYLKSDLEKKSDGGLWMRIDAGTNTVGFDNSKNRRVTGDTPWTQQQIVLDVPNSATKICFGFLMTGGGKLWADDLAIRIVGDAGDGLAVTGSPKRDVNRLNNGGFERTHEQFPELCEAWGGGGIGYELARDTTIKHTGQASGRIRSEKAKNDSAGVFTQVIAADEFRDKRVRLTGYLKTQDVNTAGLWMRVDKVEGGVSAFDNMQNRPIKGSSDWAEHSIVLDVGKDAAKIALGFLMTGGGTTWGDTLTLEVVGPAGQGPATTGLSSRAWQPQTDLSNGDFEATAPNDRRVANQWGGGGSGFRLTRDESFKHSGSASGKISGQGRFGTFTQMFPAKKYLGRRVELSGFLKTEDAEQAGLWMRVDGPDRRTLAFDNMSNRAVSGTTDWKQHAVVLDVPYDAKFIALGFLLVSSGTAWGDDLKLEIVGDEGEGPASTNMLK